MMNLRITIVLVVMALAVVSALLPIAPDEAIRLATTATQDEPAGAAAASLGWR